jgi:hypothetical protein
MDQSIRHMATRTSSPTTTASDADEALRLAVHAPAARRLIAAGVKRGNDRLIIQAVTV